MFLDLKRKGKNIKRVSADNIKSIDDTIDYEKKYNLVKEELKKMYWYDRKIFELINSGESIASLSRKTGIQYYSLYNTYNKVKNKLKLLL